MRVTSQPLTFLDTTDSRKLEVYIASNHPTIQLYDSNSKLYTPDWSIINLTLRADVFLDSAEKKPEKMKWYRQLLNEVNETEISTGDYTEQITISNNMSSGIVTYICRVEYQGIQAFSKITFTKTDTGLNGINGKDGEPAPPIQAQYSVDGNTGWTPVLDSATHKYIRYSYDGGINWTTSIKMVGEDGTSVIFKGTATSKSPISGTPYYTLIYNSEIITGAIFGDAYLLESDGHLYVCVDSRSGNDYFMDVGRIQGPKGNDGVSQYVYIRYASKLNPSDTEIKLAPSSTTTHIGICVTAATSAPLTANSYTWSKFVGDNAKSIHLNGTSQIFKVTPGTPDVYFPTTIMVTAQTINTSVSTWEYSLDGGISWVTTAPDGVVLNSDANRLTITGFNLIPNSLVIRASDGIYKDTYTVYKIFDGVIGPTGNQGDSASIAFLTNENVSFAANSNGVINNASILQVVTSVASYTGTVKQMPTIGTIANADIPSGMKIEVTDDTLLQEKRLTISFENNATLGSDTSNSGTITIPVTYPVVTNLRLSWSKINTGLTGTDGKDGNAGTPGADAVTFQIYSSNGYALSINNPTVTLQTFAYIGDIAITAGAIYQWYVYNDSGWTAISGGTNAYLTITREDVAFSKSYMCKMTFGGVEYTSVATIDDKNDENKVFTTKPSNYAAGDLWVVGVDYAPAGVAVGTLLRAEHTNATYGDVDWVIATKYDKELNDLKDNIETYNQYFSFDSAEGLKISAKDNNGTPSQFSTSLTNERLSFNYGNEAIAYINGTKMNIKEAEIESPLTVTGKYLGSTMLQAPVINIGNFSIIVESNGSLSIVANT
jgi:hypothetical protein